MVRGDPIKDFMADDDRKYEAEKRQPHCCICGQAIWDDYLYDFIDALYCENCMKSTYRKSTDNYIKE